MLSVAKENKIMRFLIKKKAYVYGFIIHVMSYITAVTVERDGLIFESRDFLFLIIIMIPPLFFAILFEKYNPLRVSALSKLKNYFYSFILSLGLISFIMNIFFSQDVSRFVVFGSLFLSFVIEMIFLLINPKFHLERTINLHFNFSIVSFLFETALFILTFIFFPLVHSHSYPPFIAYPFIYYACFFFWFISSLLIHNYQSIRSSQNFYIFIWERIKANLIFVTITSFIVFVYNIDRAPGNIIILSTIAFSVNIVVLFSLVYIFSNPAKSDEIKASFKTISEYKENISLAMGTVERYSSPLDNFYSPYLSEQLLTVYLRKFPGVFDFIYESLELATFDFRRCIMIRSADVYNVEILPERYVEFYMNLHEINDIRNINDYYSKINQCLLRGGFYIGRVEPTHLRFERFLNRYPYHLARLFYFFDFLWRRVFPNMPFLRKIYFAFSNGKKRVISFPEALGRLYYCGFEICNYKQFQNYIYFICRKVKDSYVAGNPAYGPLIKLKRIGLNGKVVNIYKFRTMHPYSEFIQKFIYDKNNLAQGGKIRNDFRITGWGRILRKFWLDELPMLLNFIKGDIKLVGVRPLSPHYLSIYDKDLQESRIKYKPGILPPFYYDMPKTIDEIMNSERRYLASYEKNPFMTDIKYFFVILFNILVKKARSK